jgi:hypothetical protein
MELPTISFAGVAGARGRSERLARREGRVALASILWLGCSGVIDGSEGAGAREPASGAAPGRAGTPGAWPGSAGATPGSPGASGATTPGAPGVATPGQPGTSAPGAAGDPNAAGLRPLRRLTRREYNNTVRDLLGDTSRPADSFPEDSDETFLFRRAGLVAQQDATVLRSAAETLGLAAARNPKPLLPCDPAAGEPACARQFIETFGLHAFRRPLHADELDRLLALYDTGRTTMKLAFADAVGLLVEAMLQAPGFLYHREVAPGPAAREGAVLRLGPYEIASRLSYFLWGTMPDKDLFAAAAAGRLTTPAEIDAQARRMLMDAKARETVATFFAEWLKLDELKERPKNPKVYPEYNAALQDAMLAEVRTFVQSVVFDGDARWGTLLGATYSFVNQTLGPIYGMPQVKGATLARTELPTAQRRGFLTQSGFLTLTGAADGSHPVKRGVEVYERFLCRALPPPPSDVPPAKPPTPGLTTRERFAEHALNECARGCHGLFDPIGFAFEHYDGIGRHRVVDSGKPVDASGELNLDGQSRRFKDAIELSTLFAGSEDTRRCLATEWLRFALGRPETEADRASLEAAVGALTRSESNLRELLVAVATSRTFRYRSPAAGEVLQ